MTRMNLVPVCRRWLAGTLAALIGLGPLATPGYAALTALGDQPLSAQTTAAPNIMLTVDDSTSMLYDFLPDTVIGNAATFNYCRDVTGKMNAACGKFDQAVNLIAAGRGKYISPGYVYEQAGYPFPAYDATYSDSGPGAGCSPLGLPTTTCSGGIAPGALPGFERYPNPAGPPPAKSPMAGKVYEYWTLWPAPAHNSELNHLYYNPRLTYEPPILADLSGSYPQLDSGATTGWTKVPADPFASLPPWAVAPPKLVDLTAKVTVGQWCNSDWSVGNEDNPAHCRTNGTGPTATHSWSSTPDGDYGYPWAPAGINPDDGLQPSTAMSIALSKVKFDIPSNSYVLQAPWTSGDAKDSNYYYENDNMLWCDPTNPLFPSHGVLAAGICLAAPPKPQTCDHVQTQTCDGGTDQTCSPTTPQNCGGGTLQTCTPMAQICGSAVLQTCDPQAAQTCDGIGFQGCGPAVPQTCDGVTPQVCGGFAHEPCVGVTPQVCNFPSPTCDPAPITCGSYDPPGCDTACGGHECPVCTWNACPATCSTNPGQTCSDASECPAPGSCSSSGAFCDAGSPCPTLQGHCVPDGGGCFDSSTCPMAGNCNPSGAFCRPTDPPSACPTLQGHCSSDHAPCFDAVSSTDCNQNEGRCTLTGNFCTAATATTDCPTLPGKCTISSIDCFNTTPSCDRPNLCSGTHAACTGATAATDCPPLGGVCTVDFLACTPTPDTCATNAGHCSIVGNICHDGNGDCPETGGTCSGGTHAACTVATAATDCPTLPGQCSSDLKNCMDASTCKKLGAHCSNDSHSCDPANAAVDCPDIPGNCSDTGNTCSTATAATDCPAIPSPGACQGFPSITCTLNSDCPASTTGPASAVCSDTLTGSNTFLNGSFESAMTGIAAFADPSNNPPLYEYRPGEPGVGWTFNFLAGIQRQGGAFGAQPSFDGVQTAFLQWEGSSIAQAMVLNAGVYTLAYRAARRDWSCTVRGNPATCWFNALLNPVRFTVDGVQVGPLITPPDIFFRAFTIPVTIATTGVHTFKFESTNTVGDTVTFLDGITIGTGATFMSLLEDANGAGAVCRHNNKDYGGGNNRYNYPDDQYNTPVTGGTGPNACTPSPRYATVARHYWKTSIEWCDHAVTTPGDKWLGYGKQPAATCQASSDTTHTYPRFFQYGVDVGCTDPTPGVCTPIRAPDAAYTDNYAHPAFERVVLDKTVFPLPTYTHDWVDDSGVLQPVSRSFDEEMTNYANWFAYYRTRITAVKSVTSLAFNVIDDKYRVGLHSLSTNPPNSLGPVSHFINIDDFGTVQKKAWLKELFSFKIPLGFETPSLDAMVRIGDYYYHGFQGQLTGASDPIKLSCQKNWHFFFTDGYTNQPGVPVAVGNVDGTPIPTYPINPTPLPLWSKNSPIPSLPSGGAWPSLFHENPAATSDALSDYAMHYWLLNMRPAMTFNVPASAVDPASWQHVNFAAIAMGTSGKLPSGSTATTESQLATGALVWPQTVPTVNRPDASGVDDLWHAAINGRGDFVNAQTPDEVKLGIGALLQAALNSTGTRAGVGLVSNTFGPNAKFLYRAGFEPGWGGTLTKIPYDPTTGVLSPPVWDAAAQLAIQLQIDIPHGKITPWFTERRIVTMDEAHNRVPFKWDKLGANQQDSLAPGKAARGQAIVEYLRGNRAKEGVKLNQFRKRPVNTVLGDFVDSSAVFVGPPNAPYLDGNDPGYSGFATGAAKIRAATVYAGANDGMLHAFDDTTGNETWAYVPTPLFRGGTAGGDVFAGVGALALQDGALPPFRHHFYVDSTPRVVDVDFNAPHGDQWRSLLVAGMGKGGNRYYALDVTNPVASTDAEDAVATNHVLWEFPPVGDTTIDMGYTYGRPIIAKTHADAFGGEWMVIVPSGYNNPLGQGKLYFLRASDGHLEYEMTTGFGTPGAPAGLAHAAGYTMDFRNQLVEQIYAGDLYGNFWRFDVSDPDHTKWSVGLMANLVGDGAPQPVTTPPEIKIDPISGVDRWVFVGTGKLLDDSDLTTPDPPQQQTMYAFRDGTDVTPIRPLPAMPLSRGTPGMEPVTHLAVNNFGLPDKPDKGWYDDLPFGQRIVVPPAAAIGVVAYIGTSPPLGSCFTGQPATVYARSYMNAQSLLNDPITDVLTNGIYSAEGAVGVQIVAFDSPAGASGSDVRLAVTTNDSVKWFRLGVPPLTSGFRMTWRLLGQ